jgi:predicted transcriptional regulator
LGKNRDRLDIVAAVLEAAKSGASKTRIMDMARLSFALLEKYLEVVRAAGFVQVEGSKYEMTEKGQEFLKNYKHFLEHYVSGQKLLKALSRERQQLNQFFDIDQKENIPRQKNL